MEELRCAMPRAHGAPPMQVTVAFRSKASLHDSKPSHHRKAPSAGRGGHIYDAGKVTLSQDEILKRHGVFQENSSLPKWQHDKPLI